MKRAIDWEPVDQSLIRGYLNGKNVFDIIKNYTGYDLFYSREIGKKITFDDIEYEYPSIDECKKAAEEIIKRIT